ncbi:uncharacterized protein LOC115717681 [Cannabis sativa]|uniref:uncharacterized protein LOC115717681 n=1 Tax=Cannabis sativa TaxID=3483 RepID=UPI0029C9CEED|nr:uncharacterized protein LOC115717681 [Cannabis sativa]
MVLWEDLCSLATNEKWLIMSDFKAILAKEERVGHWVNYHMDSDFIRCMQQCQLEDVKATDCFYTCSDKQQGKDRIFSKRNRILANQHLFDHYPNAEELFINEGIFDHTPGILSLYPRWTSGKKHFKYFRMLNTHLEYSAKAKVELDEIQDKIQLDPNNPDLHSAEVAAREKLIAAHKNYNFFLEQRLKLYGFKMVIVILPSSMPATSREQDKIKSFQLKDGIRVIEPAQEANAFISYYKSQFGSKMADRRRATLLTKEFSKEDVKKALLEIPGNKTPGPDGYSSFFFQANRDLVGEDLFRAVTFFWNQGRYSRKSTQMC